MLRRTCSTASGAASLHSGTHTNRHRIGSSNPIVTAQADDVWRMFYNALSGDALRSRVMVEGEADLVAPLLRTRSVVV